MSAEVAFRRSRLNNIQYSGKSIERTNSMGMRFVVVAAALTLLTIGRPALAHHSANAEFDTTKHFTLTGTLTKLEIVNPHSWWYLDVKNADGSVTHWRLESIS